MNFDFIPYKLNADISDFENNIQYISSDNGVDLYRVREGFQKSILSIIVSAVNLYFFEGNLITVYIHLAENPESLSQVIETLEDIIKRQAIALKTDSGIEVGWNNETEFLGLGIGGNCNQLYLYFTLGKYSVV